MAVRKRRVPVVLDTNVFVRAFKSRQASSPNKQVVRRWLVERRLQLVLSNELLEEYMEVFRDVVGMKRNRIHEWRSRFEDDSRVSLVRLGKRFSMSRDPDDNVVLAIAHAGKAQFLVSNDKDLLDLPSETRRRLSFDIMSASEFLEELGTGKK